MNLCLTILAANAQKSNDAYDKIASKFRASNSLIDTENVPDIFALRDRICSSGSKYEKIVVVLLNSDTSKEFEEECEAIHDIAGSLGVSQSIIVCANNDSMARNLSTAIVEFPDSLFYIDMEKKTPTAIYNAVFGVKQKSVSKETENTLNNIRRAKKNNSNNDAPVAHMPAPVEEDENNDAPLPMPVPVEEDSGSKKKKFGFGNIFKRKNKESSSDDTSVPMPMPVEDDSKPVVVEEKNSKRRRRTRGKDIEEVESNPDSFLDNTPPNEFGIDESPKPVVENKPPKPLKPVVKEKPQPIIIEEDDEEDDFIPPIVDNYEDIDEFDPPMIDEDEDDGFDPPPIIEDDMFTNPQSVYDEEDEEVEMPEPIVARKSTKKKSMPQPVIEEEDKEPSKPKKKKSDKKKAPKMDKSALYIQSRPRIVYVTGTGRIGQSTLAASLGFTASQFYCKSLIVDLDMIRRAISCIYQDYANTSSVYSTGLVSAIRSPHLIEEIATEHYDGVSTIGISIDAEDNREIMNTVTPEAIQSLLLQALTKYNLVVVDIPWDYLVANPVLMTVPHDILFTTSNDIMTMISDLNHLTPDSFSSPDIFNMLISKMRFVLNMTSPENVYERKTITEKNFNKVCYILTEEEMFTTIPVVANIPMVKGVGNQASYGKPASSFSEEFASHCSEILHELK